MNVAVTATSGPLTRPQFLVLSSLLALLRDETEEDWFLHGGCVGGDRQLWDVARNRLGYRSRCFPGRPLTDPARAITFDDVVDPVPPTRTPELTRNRTLVAAADVLLAGPRGRETLRSGEWATVRYARDRGIPIAVVMPDGTKSTEFAESLLGRLLANAPALGPGAVS